MKNSPSYTCRKIFPLPPFFIQIIINLQLKQVSLYKENSPLTFDSDAWFHFLTTMSHDSLEINRKLQRSIVRRVWCKKKPLIRREHTNEIYLYTYICLISCNRICSNHYRLFDISIMQMTLICHFLKTNPNYSKSLKQLMKNYDWCYSTTEVGSL